MTAIFLAGLPPQFVTPAAASVAALLALGGAFAVTTFAGQIPYAPVVAKAGNLLRRPVIQGREQDLADRSRIEHR